MCECASRKPPKFYLHQKTCCHHLKAAYEQLTASEISRQLAATKPPTSKSNKATKVSIYSNTLDLTY